MMLEDILNQFEIILEDNEGSYKDRMIRYLENDGIFQIGTNDFERWSVSTETEFCIWTQQQELVEYLRSL